MNTDKPTPRTDQKYETICESWSNSVSNFPEMTEFARQLERELTAVTEQRDAVTLRLGNTQERMFNAERQRDRLAEALERILEYQGRFAEEDPESIATEALQSIATNHFVDANNMVEITTPDHFIDISNMIETTTIN
jgi:hypothetical protein